MPRLQSFLNHKYFYITVCIIALLAYSFVVFAAAPSGGYLPGATLNPDCAPGDTSPEPCIAKTLTASDEGTPFTNNIVDIDFVGSGVTATESGGALTVTIAGGGGSGVTTLAAIGSTPNANGATISGSTLNLEPASASFGGVVSTATQTFAGEKTFDDTPTFATMTEGSIFFAGTGGMLSENNSSLFWDSATTFLGLGTNTPAAKMDITLPSDSNAVQSFVGSGVDDATFSGTYAGLTSSNVIHAVVDTGYLYNQVGYGGATFTGPYTGSIPVTYYVGIQNIPMHDQYTISASLDDATFDGTYTGGPNAGNNDYFEVTINDANTPDTFNWTSSYSGSGFDVPITAGPITLANGITVEFGATTGHSVSDNWGFTVNELTTEEFFWGDGNGGSGSDIPVTLGPIALSNGVTIEFDSDTGHQIGWFWSIDAQPENFTIYDDNNEMSGSYYVSDSPQDIGNGISIVFSTMGTHTPGDQWSYTITPGSSLALQIGDGIENRFQVDSFGDILKIKNVDYSWPNAQAAGAGYVLTNDGAGSLTWEATAVTGITSLGGLTDGTQTFATGTSGSNFNISSSGGVHTFNIPDAGASARGLVTTGTQTFAGAKTFSSAPTFSSLTTNGGVFYGNGSGTLQQTVAGTSTTVLHGGTSPSYSAVALTTDVSGILPLANGGTNANLTASNGGIFYSTGSAGAILSGTATAGLALVSGASTTPSWFTPTAGSAIFAGTGGILQQDNASFFFDDGNNRLGILDATPAAAFTVGSGDLFQVNSSGNIVKINNVTYSWPGSQGGASTVLTNNGSGTLTWGAGGINALAAIGSSANANGATISGTTLNLEPASASFGGVVTTGTQTFAGDKIFNNSIGIGDSSPVSPLTVGSGDLFQVNSSGNIVKINNVTYSWPSAQATSSGKGLVNNGSGTLTWSNVSLIGSTSGVTTSPPAGGTTETWLGSAAGLDGASTVGTVMIGAYAGRGATNAGSSVFIGANAGGPNGNGGSDPASTNAAYSVFIGAGAGARSADAAHSIFIGYGTGNAENVIDNTVSGYSILIGESSQTGGYSNSIVLGNYAGNSATNQLKIGGGGTAGTEISQVSFNTPMEAPPSEISIYATDVGVVQDTSGSSLLLAAGKGTGNASGGSLIFQTADIGTSGFTLQSLSTKATLTQSGFFGIGDTTPDYKLDIEGNSASTYMASFFNDGGNDNRWGIQIQAGADTPSANKWIQFNDGDGTDQGSICYTGGQANVCAPSDERLKENITETNVTLDDLLAIQVKDFSYISDEDETTRHGFIAQELYEVYPDAVSKPVNPNEFWKVAYNQLTPLIIKAIQDLNAKIENLFTNANFIQNLIAWLGNMGNGITDLFANVIHSKESHTDKLCVGEVCVTQNQFLQIVQQSTAQTPTPTDDGSNDEQLPVPTDEPDPVAPLDPDVILDPLTNDATVDISNEPMNETEVIDPIVIDVPIIE